MPSPPVHSRAELRRALEERFRTVPEFDRFCCDHFPEVSREFGSGMDRSTRENLLLEGIPAARIWEALQGGSASSASPALPPNNLPLRNPTFVGRVAQLEELHRMLSSEGRASVAPRKVFGLGGIGKTALATEYAHRYAHDYPGGLWWVRAEGSPLDAIVAFAGELRLLAPHRVRSVLDRVPENAPSEEVARGVRLALQAHVEPTLLVLDNVSDANWRDHLPGGAVRVLITTRDRGLCGDDAPLFLEGLSQDEARALADSLATRPEVTAELDARDRVILHDLGGLPVAVELAARAVSRWGLRWSKYREMLHTEPATVLESEELRGDYPRGALSALDLSVRRVPIGSPARRLLEGAVVFGPDEIPRTWILRAAREEDGVRARRAFEQLQRLGLLTASADGERWSIHRLLRTRVRHLASGSGARSWWERFWGELVRAVHRCTWRSLQLRALHCTRDWMNKTVDVGRLAEVEGRRAHVEELLAQTQAVDERAWSVLADRLGTHLWHRAEHHAAKDLLERALHADEAALGPDHPTVATSLSNLALVLLGLGDAAAARPLLERALRIHETTFGTDHPTVAVSLSNLAMVLQDLGEAAEARPLMEHALRIHETTFGPDHPNVAVSLSNLAMVFKDLGDAARARPLLERALRIDETTVGTEHPNVARRLSNLALVLKDLGDSAGARPLLERALRIHETTFGPDHPTVAVSLSNLATVLHALGDATAARPLLERALRIDETTFGTEHPNVATRLSNLALVQEDLGDAAAARPLLERALRIADARLGPDHPLTRTIRNNLAGIPQHP